ncbi:facilitated trehalose transporter Tret1-like isoform X1 [Coccinella septempunctata]|uniref:facilitated trehalose transporter Tret1-like isoform X1 n=1 Tax=Coccinella septempunctata TaxID=41139 RepID=UPI001D08B4E2|nr:facilitated trehalose transporter Tret1-like isoform X1 [Coccinella septempunctata]XP_044762797.1 facilitated trehalose transporter Tret1-like isoform X1 [Coccinella septempunctata]
MDPIGTSCFSLNIEENARAILEEKKQDEKFQEIIVSCRSLSRYEGKKTKTLVPQLVAASLAALYHLVVGISLAYSAILLPQLKEDKDFNLTPTEESWIASIIVLTVPIGAPIGGILMDMIGRLNTVKLAAIPGIIGWTLIATAHDLPMMLLGRVFNGFASALGTGPAIVYLTEIARADMRGSLISLAPAYTSFGMVMVYAKGWFMNWRTVAWLSNIYTIVPCILIMFIPESPAWLVSKGRTEDALKSLDWINKYQPQPENRAESLAELQLAALQKEHQKKMESEALTGTGIMTRIKDFMKPTGYKPLIILVGLFFFQQFAGIYITLFYSVQLFKEVGSTMNPYFASVLLGSLRCLMSMVNTYMLRTFRRRPLIMTSGVGMAICMCVSALFTKWIQQKETVHTWVPVAALAMYVVTSMIGLLNIPWTMTAELFPIEIRGMAHSLSNAFAYLLMFVAIQTYYGMKSFFHGLVGTQLFYAAISVSGSLYVLLVLPETHKKKLKEIEEYFLYNTFYLCQNKKKSKKARRTNSVPKMTMLTSKDIVRNAKDVNTSQSEKLLPR